MIRIQTTICTFIVIATPMGSDIMILALSLSSRLVVQFLQFLLGLFIFQFNGLLLAFIVFKIHALENRDRGVYRVWWGITD